MPEENERRHDDGPVRERLARIEARQETTTEEIAKLRVTTHDLVTHQATLGLMAEEARESRANLGNKIDGLATKIDPMMVAVAQGATTVAMHVQQCTAHNAEQDRRHSENQARFARLERTIYFATGGASVFWALASAAMAFYKH